MSIKPVDFQVLIPKALEVSKVNNDEAQRSLATQQQQASSMQHKVDNSLSQVYSQSRPQNARIMEKPKSDSRERDKKKKGKPGGSEAKSLNNDMRTSTIDIKI